LDSRDGCGGELPATFRARGTSFPDAEAINLFPCNLRVFINLTPFIPLSFKGEGKEIYREGFHPSLTYTPPSLVKGRGQGDRLLNNLSI
jgi:hypothetical protein